MPIKPIDMQIMIPRLNEVSRVQVSEQQHSLAAQQNKALATEKKSEDSMRQVNSRKEDEKKIIKDKHQRHKGKSNSKGSTQEQDENKRKQNKELMDVHLPGGTIDIRL